MPISIIAAIVASSGRPAAVGSPFKLLIDTNYPGTTPDSFLLGVNGTAGPYNYTIDWGDSSTPQIITSNTSLGHTYATGGVYTISILENVSGGFPALYMLDGDGERVIQVSQWGTNKFTYMGNSFRGCTNMTLPATDYATADTGSVTQWVDAFFGCTSLTSFPLLNTSGGTTFSEAWGSCSGLLSFPALNMAACHDFSYSWYGCSSLASFPNINVSSGNSFEAAFTGCVGLNGYNFPTLNCLDLNNGTGMFDGVTLSTTSWSNFLINLWNSGSPLNTGVTISGGASKHNASAASAITDLTNNFGWSISDGGLE